MVDPSWANWGGRNERQNRAHVGLLVTQSPATVSAGTSSVTLTVDGWVGTEFGATYSFTATLSGALSWSGTVSIAHGSSGGSTRVFRRTLTVPTEYAQAVKRSFTMSISGLALMPTPPSKTLTHTVAARPVSAPNAATNVAAVRVSDTKTTVSWEATSTAARPISSQVVQRSWWLSSGEWSTWRGSGTVGAGARSASITTVANNSYRFRVVTKNAAGSTNSGTATLRTTPAAPVDVVAEKQADGSIEVTYTPRVPYTSDLEHVLQDNPGGTGWVQVLVQGGSGKFTIPAPDPAQTHQFQVATRETRGGLTSVWSAPSQVVQLLARPDPPTLTGPSGTVPRDADIPLSWIHNPVDSSKQTAYELRYKVNGGGWTTLTGTTALTRVLAALGVSGVVEWQVRTKGAHHEWSDWSQVASFTLAARPTVVINTPSGPTLPQSRVDLLIGYDQEDGSPQARVQAELVHNGIVIEALNWSSTDDAGSFTTALDDGEAYTVRVRVQAGNGLWSNWDTVTFTADFPRPVPHEIVAAWDRATGAVVVSGSATDEPGQYDWTGTPDNSTSTRTTSEGTVTNLFTNPDMQATSGDVVVWENRAAAPSADDPNFAGFSQGTGGAYTVTFETGGGPLPGEPNFWRARADVPAPSGSGGWRTYHSGPYRGDVSGGAGDKVTIGLWMRYTGGLASITQNIRAYLYNSSTAGAQVDAQGELVSGVWTLMRVTVEAGGAFDSAGYWAFFSGGDRIDPGGTIDIGAQMVVPGEYLPEWFSSTYSPDPDLTPRARPGGGSQLVGQLVGGVSAVRCVAVQSERWSKSGGRSVRLIKNDDSGLSWATIYGMAAGETAAVWRYQDAVLNVAHSSNFGRISFGTVSPIDWSDAAPNAPGEVLVRNRRVDNTSQHVLLGHYGGIGESVWFDMLTVTDTEGYAGPPFSGASQSYVEAETLTYQRRDTPDSPWVTLAENVDPGTTITDPTPALAAPEYRAISHTSLPSSTTGPVTVVPWVHDRDPIYVNSGPSFEMVATAVGRRAGDTPSIEQGAAGFAGFDYPLPVFGEGSAHTTTFQGVILPHDVEAGRASTRAEWIDLLHQRQVVCYRDCQGRKVFGLLSLDFAQDGPVHTVTITVNQVWHQEGIPL